MPGPLGTLGPTVDPNWAWNTPAWTNQGNTGDTESTGTASPGGVTPGFVVTPPAVATTATKNTNGITAQIVLTNVGSLTTSVIIKDAAGTTLTLGAPAVNTPYMVPPGGSIAFGGGTVGAAVWVWQLLQ